MHYKSENRVLWRAKKSEIRLKSELWQWIKIHWANQCKGKVWENAQSSMTETLSMSRAAAWSRGTDWGGDTRLTSSTHADSNDSQVAMVTSSSLWLLQSSCCSHRWIRDKMASHLVLMKSAWNLPRSQPPGWVTESPTRQRSSLIIGHGISHNITIVGR